MSLNHLDFIFEQSMSGHLNVFSWCPRNCCSHLIQSFQRIQIIYQSDINNIKSLLLISITTAEDSFIPQIPLLWAFFAKWLLFFAGSSSLLGGVLISVGLLPMFVLFCARGLHLCLCPFLLVGLSVCRMLPLPLCPFFFAMSSSFLRPGPSLLASLLLSCWMDTGTTLFEASGIFAALCCMEASGLCLHKWVWKPRVFEETVVIFLTVV